MELNYWNRRGRRVYLLVLGSWRQE